MKPILKLNSIVKTFPGVTAVNKISLELFEGEVLALLGENGAGKSTLMKILCGVHKPNQGDIYRNDQQVTFSSAHDALNQGIAVVHQELSLVGSLSIAENIFMNRQPLNRIKTVDWELLYKNTNTLLKRFNLKLNPKMPVRRLSMGQQQMVEILKAVSTSPDVLVLDEPTSSLTDKETEELFGIINGLKKDGVSFIYITHKLTEVFTIADRTYIMRDGQYISSNNVKDVDEQFLISQMVGREVTNLYGNRNSTIRKDKKLLEVQNLNLKNKLKNINFHLNPGEILGVAGLIGAGRTEMALSIFGIEKAEIGSIRVKGKKVDIQKPRDAIYSGLAYLTEDRKALGLYLNESIHDNLIAPNLKLLTDKLGKVDKAASEKFVNDKIEQYNIVATSSKQKVGNLSGGNQQKCLYSMWVGTDPEILILDEPTRGVDVGAREELYHNVRTFAEKGGGVLLISSDMLELIGLSDRILVMHEGQISGEIKKDDFTEEKILSYAAGINMEVV